MNASSSCCGLKSGMKLSRSGEGADGGLWGLLGPPPPNDGGSMFGLFPFPNEGCSRLGLFGFPKEGCSRFGRGLAGFPKSTKEPTGGDGRDGCLSDCHDDDGSHDDENFF